MKPILIGRMTVSCLLEKVEEIQASLVKQMENGIVILPANVELVMIANGEEESEEENE